MSLWNWDTLIYTTLNVIGLIIELFDNLDSELVAKYEFFKPITIEEIVIFMIVNRRKYRRVLIIIWNQYENCF